MSISELAEKEILIVKDFFSQLKPKSTRDTLQYSKDEGYLSAESSAVTGRFVPFDYQEEILKCNSDDDIYMVVWLKSTRVGYTKVINFCVAYDIEQDPCPQLIFQPNDGKANEWSKKELKPLLRDMKSVGEKILKGREDNNLNYKAYSGGFLESRGGKSSNNYASATVKKVRADEYSRFPDDVDGEGDPRYLMEKRIESYWNGQMWFGSTPTVKYHDKTEALFEETDKRYRYVPCPHCNHYQVIDFFKHIKWEKEYREGVKTHLTHTAYMECENCNGKIEHNQKKKMGSKGRWLQTKEFFCCEEWQDPKQNRLWYFNTEDIEDKRNGEALCLKCNKTAEYNRIGRKKRGYHIWAGYSYQPNTTWTNIVEAFVNAIGSVDKMRAFFNTWLGESFEEENLKIDKNKLIESVEHYKTVPEDAKVILMTVDTQNDRLEYLITAWCDGETSYNLKSGIVMGDPINKGVFAELLEIKQTPLRMSNGRDVYVHHGFIDMGGQRTDEVKAFVRENRSDFMMLKGDDKEQKFNDARSISRIKETEKEKDIIMWVATTKAKDIVFERLSKLPSEHGFIHHNDTFENEWFEQITSEKKVFKKNKRGYIEGTYVKTRERNEALDLICYQLAAIRLIQQERGFSLLIDETKDKVEEK